MIKRIDVPLTSEEINELILALTFAYNSGTTPEEFGSLYLIAKLKDIIKEEEE